MPELVEVENSRRNLNKILINKRIIKTEVYLDKMVFNKKEEFIKKTTNKVIHEITRRGKWLFFRLDDSYLVTHFRMQGRFYLKDNNYKRQKHDYIIFSFNDFKIVYNDPRLFGNMQIINLDEKESFIKEKNLGLEYFDDNLTSKYLRKKFKKHHVYIKNMLLDQSVIAGIGNIYADEILFRSNINPKSYADKLTLNKLDKIIKNTSIVFEEALKYKGTYPNLDGIRGTYEEHLLVHKRKDKKCYVCGSIIIKEQVGKRGTYYCPKCQK